MPHAAAVAFSDEISNFLANKISFFITDEISNFISDEISNFISDEISNFISVCVAVNKPEFIAIDFTDDLT